MSEAVVHLLEMVDVEHDHRSRSTVTSTGGSLPFGNFEEVRAIGSSGEVVSGKPPSQRADVGGVLCHGADNDREPRNISSTKATFLAADGDQPLAPLSRTVAARAPALVEMPPIASGEYDLLVTRQCARGRIVLLEDVKALPKQFMIRKPGLSIDRAVDVIDQAICVELYSVT